MSQENIAYERELGNINIRGKRGKIPFNVSPVAVEAYKDRIDSEIPVVVPQEVKDIVHSRYLVEQGEKERQDALVGAKKDASSSVKGANLDNIGLSRVTPIDTYRMEHEYNVTPSNEINYHDADAYTAEQAQRIKEEAFKDEEKKASAPVVDENVPIIDETLEYEPPTEEMKKFEEEKTQAQWQKDYLDSIYSQADYEADEKKKKAAQWITAAQMLGDSIAALGNSYFTAKGANAMTLSNGSQKAAEATYKLNEDIRNARERAARTKYELEKARKEWEYRKEKDKQAQADSDRKHEETVRHNKAIEETSRLNAGTAARNASVNEAEERRKVEQYNKQHGDRKFLIGDQWVNIPKDKWEGVVGSIYNSLPEEVRKVYETQVTDELGIKKETRKAPTIAVMDAAVRQYAQDPAVMEAILKSAGIKTEEVDPKEDKREKENTSTNNTELPIQAYSAPADEWGSQWRRRAGLDTTDFSQFKRK